MAGLGEACSHIAALLFTLDANTQVKKGLSHTSVPCYWLLPTFKSVPFARICDIDFTTPQKKKRKLLDLQIHPPTNAITTHSPLNLPIPTTNVKASETELECLYKAHSKAGKSVLLSLVPGHAEAFVPLQAKGALPLPLRSQYKQDYLQLSYPDLLSKCEAVCKTLSVTSEQAKLVDEKTRKQSNSRIWFQQRAGRVTASRFKVASQTDITQPSKSLIKAICYPESSQFKIKCYGMGCKHKKTALEAYTHQEGKHHS